MNRVNKFLPDVQKLIKYKQSKKVANFLDEVGGKILAVIGLIIVSVFILMVFFEEKIGKNESAFIFFTFIAVCVVLVCIIIVIEIKAKTIVEKEENRVYKHYSYLLQQGYKYHGYKIDKGNPQYIKVLYAKVLDEIELSSRTIYFDFKAYCEERMFSKEKILSILEGKEFDLLHRMSMVKVNEQLENEEIERIRRNEKILEKAIEKYWEVPTYQKSE
jgi:hypothetical protein